MEKSEADWQKILSPEQYKILRQKGTEAPFSGKFNSWKNKGTFICAGCKQKLFHSSAKYDSGSGWPSFFQAIDKKAILEEDDSSHGMRRIEILCSNCGGHLGHVFEDGPNPTGLRYCVNSLSLEFKEE